MIQASNGRLGVLALMLLAGVAPARAQTVEGILAPAGHLRLQVAPTWQLWDRRFGLREGAFGPIEEEEPLGFDLEHEPLLRFPALEQGLREALGDPGLELVLGSARAEITREQTTVSLGAALGVSDWLTVGVEVPLVETRTEIAFDFRALGGADLGLAPTAQSIDAFRASLLGSQAALRARREEQCPGGPDCTVLTELLDRYQPFAATLHDAYDAPVFLTSSSDAAADLEQKLAEFRMEAAERAPGVTMPGAAPLADAPLNETQLVQLLTTHPSGPRLFTPLQTNRAPFQIGDVEVSAAVRLLEGAFRDSASAPVRLRYVVGVGALVRLPTGTIDDPDVPLDLSRADGQLDVEARGFADLRWGRFGIKMGIRRGFPRGTTLIRRVAPPEIVMAPLETRRTVRWTPGGYLELEASPRWHLTDELALGVHVRRFTKDADEFEETVAALPIESLPSFPTDVLERETEATLTELGAGLAFSTLVSWREGRAGLPVEVRLTVRRAVAGSGGATPAALRLEAGGQVFVGLWGGG